MNLKRLVFYLRKIETFIYCKRKRMIGVNFCCVIRAWSKKVNETRVSKQKSMLAICFVSLIYFASMGKRDASAGNRFPIFGYLSTIFKLTLFLFNF